MENEILEFLNLKIRAEHGNRVTLESKWMDAGVDSFGTTMVFLDMDEKYGCFPNEWFKSIKNWVDKIDPETKEILVRGITIQEIVTKVLNESTKL